MSVTLGLVSGAVVEVVQASAAGSTAVVGAARARGSFGVADVLSPLSFDSWLDPGLKSASLVSHCSVALGPV